MELGCHSGDCQDQGGGGNTNRDFPTSQTTNKLEVNYQKAQAYIPAERRGVSVPQINCLLKRAILIPFIAAIVMMLRGRILRHIPTTRVTPAGITAFRGTKHDVVIVVVAAIAVSTQMSSHDKPETQPEVCIV